MNLTHNFSSCDSKTPLPTFFSSTHLFPLPSLILFSFSLYFLFTLTACTPDPNEEFIQGSWQVTTVDSDNRFFEWRFSNGAFTREQELDSTTALYTTGQYRIVESDGNLLTLELFNFSGDRISYENNPIALPIEIDRESDTARIQNTVFVRVLP